MIRAEVFEALEKPWFEFDRIGSTLPGEDTWFFLRARRASFRIFCDMDAECGHMTTVNVLPRVDSLWGKVKAEYDFDFGGALQQNVRGATLLRV